MVDLYGIYNELIQGLPSTGNQLYGIPVWTGSGPWLSTNTSAFPSLLFPASPEDTRTDISLRSIDVEFARACEIQGPQETPIRGTFTIVRLNESDPDVARLFLRLLEEAFCQSERTYSSRQIGDEILEIAELFRQNQGSDKGILGLWGELYIIAEKAASCVNAVRRWCTHPNAKHDFVCSEYALEVKTTLKATRLHRFSLEQLRSSGGFAIYVASLQVVEAPSGRTVADLFDEVLNRIDDSDLRKSFVRQCLTKGGKDIYRISLKLQALPGNGSLAIFDAEHIPVPSVGHNDPISNVRFDVSLSDLQRVQDERLAMILSFSEEDSKLH